MAGVLSKSTKSACNNLIASTDVMYMETTICMEQIERRLNALNYEINNLKAGTGNNTVRVKQLEDVANTIRDRLQSLHFSTDAKDATLAAMVTREVDMNIRLEALEGATYDGTMIFPVTDFARRRREAIKGTHPVIFSPYFYTSTYGYKMCGMLYLNGDKIRRGIYMSIYLVIVKGDYDALLKWPFTQKITFTLRSQGEGENIKEIYQPKGTDVGQPHTTSDIAYGCPLFVSLSTFDENIDNFVKDNVMFVKIEVDTSGL